MSKNQSHFNEKHNNAKKRKLDPYYYNPDWFTNFYKYSQALSNHLNTIDDCKQVVLQYFNHYLNGEKTDAFGEGYPKSKYTFKAENFDSGGTASILKVTGKADDGSELLKAVKIVQNSTMGNSEAVKGARLNHPNILKIYNIVPIKFLSCIEMEFVPYNLMDAIDIIQSIPNETIEKMLFQCFEALLWMNQNGMVHSDIKLSNILLRDLKDLDIVLADFGYTLQESILTHQNIGSTRGYLSEKKVEKGSKNTMIEGKTIYVDLHNIGISFRKLIKSSQIEVDEKIQECISSLQSYDGNEIDGAFYDFAVNVMVTKGYSSSVWENDACFVLKSMNFLDSSKIKVGDKLSRNEKFILESELFEHAHSELRSNRKFMMSAIKVKPTALSIASRSLMEDNSFLLEVVTNEPMALKHIPDNLQTEDIIKVAVQQDSKALQFVVNPVLKNRVRELVGIRN